MRYISHIDFFSIYDYVCVQKSLKHTCPGFDSVAPLHSVRDCLETFFKACVCYFHQIFIFLPNDSPSKTMKNVLFHLESSFYSQDIQIFIFLSFHFFLQVSHCFRGWPKINLKVHDIINCLNKNSTTHFVWYLEKEKRYDIETLSIDGVSDNEHFYRKIMQKICSKS